MKTLELILRGYINGEYGLKEMIDIVNEAMEYRGYKAANGKRTLKAICFGELISVEIKNADITPPIQQAKELFIKLTDDERMEVMGGYCKHCGYNSSYCQCCDDD